MAKFKVGDKVKCLSNSDGYFTKGKIYTVCSVDRYYAGNVRVELNDKGQEDGWDEWHFELYEEPLPVWVNTPQPEERPHSHYYKDFGAYLDQETGRVLVDVYAVLDEFEVREPELQHLAKKVLCLGMRGHKLADEDLDNIIDTAKRLKERRQFKEEYSK